MRKHKNLRDTFSRMKPHLAIGKRLTFIAFLAVTIAVGCSRLEDRIGYIPDESALSSVVVGRDTRDTVPVIIGRPSTQGVVNKDGWYYVRSDYERFLWREPIEVDRQVVAVTFDDTGVVSNIERFGLEEGRVIVLNRRVTESTIDDISILRQIFANVGTFDAGNFLEDG